MAEPPRTPTPPDHGTPPKAPRWVKVSGIVVAVLILLVVVAMLTGVGGDHGPGRHLGTDAADARSAAIVTEVSP